MPKKGIRNMTMNTPNPEKILCKNCRYYAEGTIYPNGSAEHLCGCPASPFLDDAVDPDGICGEFKEDDHGKD